MTEPAKTESPADKAFGKVIDTSLDLADALTEFYDHIDEIAANALAGPPPRAQGDPEGFALMVREAYDKFSEAKYAFLDAEDAEDIEEAAKVAAARAPDPAQATTTTLITGRALQ